MTLACSLIEFLESTWQGISYRHKRRRDPPFTIYEYDKSGDIFVSFIVNRKPFSTQFNLTLADSFYRLVRRGLLHKARTKGTGTISANSFQ